MKFFEYPYVIITILVAGFLVMGAIALYFSFKGARTANETEDKSFCGVGRLESYYKRLSKEQNVHNLVYIGISLDRMSRLYSESKAMRILVQLRPILLKAFSGEENGNIAIYGDKSFVAVNEWSEDAVIKCVEACADEINKVLLKNEAVNIAHVNFGLYCTRTTEVEFDMAVTRAKQAFTLAESSGVSYCCWDRNSGKGLERKIKIENNIHNEIENNKFFLEYQPIVSATTNRIFGAEVLSRLNSDSDGILSPGTFLSAVNSVGLNEKFDYYVFEKNCKWISNDKARREQYVYTINFSRSTLCADSFAESITEILDKYGVNHSCIALEILEDKNLSKEEKIKMRSNVATLRSKGIQILLDDFGSGFTSFTDLSNLDINIVKIDKEITQNANKPTGFVILKNIIKGVQDLGMKTLCEGVETEEQRRIVTEAGCDLIQGYYFYRPMPPAKLEEMLENQPK